MERHLRKVFAKLDISSRRELEQALEEGAFGHDEQMPGELIYEYTIQSTGATSYGVPALDALLSGVADIPPEGARYDLAFQGPIVGQRLRGTVELTDYIHIRPDGRVQLHIHAEITTEDGKKIALYADGVADFTKGPPVGDLSNT